MSVTGYSTDVSLTLVVEDGARLRVSQVGPSGLIIDGNCPRIPSSRATLIVSIDGKEEEHPLFLPEGIPGPDVVVPFSKPVF
jgi:hypothetical protein